jgi:hypothetical protein
MPIFLSKISRNSALFLAFIVLSTIVSGYVYYGFQSETVESEPEIISSTPQATAPISPADVIRDNNELHLMHAQANGLKVVYSSDSLLINDIGLLLRTGILVEVKENQFFKLKKLTHSHPYVIPEVLTMLNEIGMRFEAKMRERNYKPYRMVVTSLLRTHETQSRLRKRNTNATTNSSHLYGTTVDISYKDFFNLETNELEGNYEAFRTLMEVLLEMRHECKLVAVRERKQSCFHITVVVYK